ncbi:hypothetical protein TAMA11512_19350 [Selenomonas sp. TAMA-11512]|uniref:hypothetical protein n=1 Tax=Selenomonas sp. TAMA-11512 TaxID=3095337 RepID=UPI00308AE801|nr:hypothetical protein TAMA11512_19350 [Selenomonas sp. TAMA-11512]
MNAGRRCCFESAEHGALSIFAVLAMALMMLIVGAMFALAAQHRMLSHLAESNIIYKEKADDMVLMSALELELKLPIERSTDNAVLDSIEEDTIRYRRAYSYQKNAKCIFHAGKTEELFTIVVAVEQENAKEQWLPKARSVGVFRVIDQHVQLDHWEP